MNAVTIIGRYLFAIPFIILGIVYLINAESMSSIFPLPGGVAWVYVAGLIMLFAGVAMLIRKKDAVASFLLGILFLIFALMMDFPAAISSDFNDALATSQLLKDLVISGAAFVYCRSAAKDRSWRLV